MKYIPHDQSSYKLIPRLSLPVQTIHSDMIHKAIVERMMALVPEELQEKLKTKIDKIEINLALN